MEDGNTTYFILLSKENYVYHTLKQQRMRGWS